MTVIKSNTIIVCCYFAKGKKPKNSEANASRINISRYLKKQHM